jgi:hypothetical protein
MGASAQAKNGGEAAPPLGGTSRRGASSRKQHGILIAATAIGVIAILLFASGSVPEFGGTSSTPSPMLDTESQAVSAAREVTASVVGGPWNLTGAFGTSFTVAVTDRFPFVRNCSADGTTQVNASAGPFPGDYAAGVAVLWILDYSSASSGNGGLVVVVEQGRATEVGVSPDCPVYGGAALPVGSVVDSSTAVGTVLATMNGSRFFDTVSRANVSFLLSNSGAGPTWDIAFGACNYLTLGPGYLLASVWAANGTIDQTPHAYEPC